jgi:hypothetical protein
MTMMTSIDVAAAVAVMTVPLAVCFRRPSLDDAAYSVFFERNLPWLLHPQQPWSFFVVVFVAVSLVCLL